MTWGRGGNQIRKCWHQARSVLTVGIFAALLVSCFVPDEYEAEIRFTKIGAYGITYNGVLIHAPVYGELARKTITPAEAQERIKGYAKQLKNDDNFKEIRSVGSGRFQVKYSREGRFIDQHQTVTFVSRQAPIFRIRTFEDGRVSVAGSGAGRQYADKLEEVGLNTKGLFRIVTDAEVLEHNAHFVRASATPGYTIYDWRIRNFKDIPPRLIAKLIVDPKTGAPLPKDGTGRPSAKNKYPQDDEASEDELDDLAARATKKR